MLRFRIIKDAFQLCRKFSHMSVAQTGCVNPAALMNCGVTKQYLMPRNGALDIIAPITQKKVIVDLPLHNMVIENPTQSALKEINDIIDGINPITLPTTQRKEDESDAGIQAARLIVIRKRKMKKHKLKKLRKKMKFEWAKVRQRRELRKEKAFQAVLIQQIKEAERFSAQDYVEEKLKKANETPIPRYWKGRRLPQFIIKEKLGIK